jgi:hypothetical protein
MDFPQQIVEEFPQVTAWFLEHGTRILLVLVLAVVGYRLFFVLARHVKLRVQRSDGIPDSTLDKRAETLFDVITSAGLAVVATAATLTILQEVGVEIGPLLASVGIVGLALGLGAQTLVKDVINGLFVLVENQYTVGDIIEVNGLAGRVEEMTLRVTMLRDLQGVLHFIPNSEIRIVSNRSREWSRAVVEDDREGSRRESDEDTAGAKPAANGHAVGDQASDGEGVTRSDDEATAAVELPNTVRERLEAVDVATMTPLEAMNTLAELSDRLE